MPDTTDHMPFNGAKCAMICDSHLVTILRENDPAIAYPNLWDIPGGGREGDETPEQTVLREIHEEIGLVLKPERLTQRSTFLSGHGRPGSADAGQDVTLYFFVTTLTQNEVDAIVLGDEGQRWEMMPIQTFLNHDRAVPTMQTQLQRMITIHSAP